MATTEKASEAIIPSQRKPKPFFFFPCPFLATGIAFPVLNVFLIDDKS